MSIKHHASVFAAIALTACFARGSGSWHTGGSGTSASTNGPTGGQGGGAESSYGGAAGSTATTTAPTAADTTTEPRWDDFAFAVRERSGSYWAPWTITKLTTFKVGAACYARLGEAGSDALGNTSYYTRSVSELAKQWTGNDWESIENQRSKRAKDRALVEPMIDAFANNFHMTIEVEGDDCEVERGALWIRYWFAIGEAFAKYPPAGGAAFVTLHVSGDARDVTSDVDADGTHFTFTAPRDIEPTNWSDKLAKPFRKHAAKL